MNDFNKITIIGMGLIGGAVRMAFESEIERKQTFELLRPSGFNLAYGKGEEENAYS